MMGLDDAIAAGLKLADDAVVRIWPDATEVEKAKLQMLAAEMQGQFQTVLGQLDINKAEAASASVFVAGARPFILWVCGVSLAYAALFEPIARFIATVAFGYAGIFPALDTEITLQVLLGMLGLGGMRSFEKLRGVHRDRLS